MHKIFRTSHLAKTGRELIRIDQRVAKLAVEIQRDYNLKPADSMHAASALIVKDIAVLQAWDRDYDKIKHLIKVDKPQFVSPAGPLYEKLEESAHEQQHLNLSPLNFEEALEMMLKAKPETQPEKHRQSPPPRHRRNRKRTTKNRLVKRRPKITNQPVTRPV